MEAEDVFGLNGQIEHKLTFLSEHVPRDTHLVLVGHSIGCYIILEIMKKNPELKVKQSGLKSIYYLIPGKEIFGKKNNLHQFPLTPNLVSQPWHVYYLTFTYLVLCLSYNNNIMEAMQLLTHQLVLCKPGACLTHLKQIQALGWLQ